MQKEKEEEKVTEDGRTIGKTIKEKEKEVGTAITGHSGIRRKVVEKLCKIRKRAKQKEKGATRAERWAINKKIAGKDKVKIKEEAEDCIQWEMMNMEAGTR